MADLDYLSLYLAQALTVKGYKLSMIRIIILLLQIILAILVYIAST